MSATCKGQKHQRRNAGGEVGRKRTNLHGRLNTLTSDRLYLRRKNSFNLTVVLLFSRQRFLRNLNLDLLRRRKDFLNDRNRCSGLFEGFGERRGSLVVRFPGRCDLLASDVAEANWKVVGKLPRIENAMNGEGSVKRRGLVGGGKDGRGRGDGGGIELVNFRFGL
jgi:hypothetical protein